MAGVQHPAPPLLPLVSSLPAEIIVAAPYATPVFSGRNLLPARPRTQLWALLYGQVTQADGSSQRNILLTRQEAILQDDKLGALIPSSRLVRGTALTFWLRPQVEAILASLALPATTPLSVLVVEMLPDSTAITDPLGGDLGQVRILRTSPLVAVPPIC